jgi:hypothetical protein
VQAMTTVAPTKPVKSNEWYTPAKYIEAAREVLGSIDLDPASCALANETVKATRYFTKDDDGLSKAWSGNVWLNPPYGRTSEMQGRGESTIERFAAKLIRECREGNVTQAIALLTAQVDARWFRLLWDFPICFTDHKVHFDMPFQRRSYSHMFGTIFVYLGPNEAKFIDIFSAFGTVARRVTPQS